MSQPANPDRRRFLGTLAATLAAAPFAMGGTLFAQSGDGKSGTVRPGTHTAFAALKQIEAGVLDVGYAEAGPADGHVVILLHGWPYDIYAFVDGRLDRIIENAAEPCAGVAYAPFADLEKLTR